MALPRSIRYYLHRFKRLQGSIPSVATGSAIGAAIGITPTVPLHNVLIVALTLLFRVNPIAGVLVGNIVSSPLTLVPQYYLTWVIGDFCFPGRLTWERLRQILDMIKTEGIMDSLRTMGEIGFDALLVMMTGGLILAVPTGLLTYLIVHRLFFRLRQKRRQKHLLNE